MAHQHEQLERTIECAVLTVSDTRDFETDKYEYRCEETTRV